MTNPPGALSGIRVVDNAAGVAGPSRNSLPCEDDATASDRSLEVD